MPVSPRKRTYRKAPVSILAPQPPAPIVGTSAPAAASIPAVSPERRYAMVQEAAYLLAEKDGFKADPTTYWVAAEAAIDAQLGLKK